VLGRVGVSMWAWLVPTTHMYTSTATQQPAMHRFDVCSITMQVQLGVLVLSW
jgi:hypothetical protein